MPACDHAYDMGHFCKSISLIVYKQMIYYAMLAWLRGFENIKTIKRIPIESKEKLKENKKHLTCDMGHFWPK